MEKSAIASRLDALIGGARWEITINTEEVRTVGDLAFARGTIVAEKSPPDGAEKQLIDSKFLTVFRMQTDGSWKIYRDCFNSNKPPVK
ncbi:MAG TPA: DUF4440 domain-containing protein [Spirochaetia bacterium]|nr:DUF4440 domain-containing protein [Spirochaetia bacterium]